MGIVLYSLLAYLIAAAISYMLIGVIVIINHFMNRKLSLTETGEEKGGAA